MKRLGFCAVLLFGLASFAVMSAQPPSTRRMSSQTPAPTSPAPRIAMAASHAPAPSAPPPRSSRTTASSATAPTQPKADLSIERLLAQPSPESVGANWQDWEKVAEMLEKGSMPPKEATLFPTDAERAAAAAWIRTSLKAYEDAHAGDPGSTSPCAA